MRPFLLLALLVLLGACATHPGKVDQVRFAADARPVAVVTGPEEMADARAAVNALQPDGPESRLGDGARFTLELPLAQVEASEARQRLLRDPRLEPARWQPAVDVTLATSPPG